MSSIGKFKRRIQERNVEYDTHEKFAVYSWSSNDIYWM